jgi:hypothetical protein
VCKRLAVTLFALGLAAVGAVLLALTLLSPPGPRKSSPRPGRPATTAPVTQRWWTGDRPPELQPDPRFFPNGLMYDEATGEFGQLPNAAAAVWWLH